MGVEKLAGKAIYQPTSLPHCIRQLAASRRLELLLRCAQNNLNDPTTGELSRNQRAAFVLCVFDYRHNAPTAKNVEVIKCGASKTEGAACRI